jgi:hypothetical protein
VPTLWEEPCVKGQEALGMIRPRWEEELNFDWVTPLLAEEWRKEHGLTWELPTFHALANLAYNHLRRLPDMKK